MHKTLALAIFLVAHFLISNAQDPCTRIVQNNIEHCYMQIGDRANAIKYYKPTEKYGDEEIKESARRRMAALKE